MDSDRLDELIRWFREVEKSFVLGPTTTAEHYLFVRSGSPLWNTMEEMMEFSDSLEEWVKTAPETTLRQLIPAAEVGFLKLTGTPYETGLEESVYRLLDAHQHRNIPTREEWEALAARLPQSLVKGYLAGALVLYDKEREG